MRISAHCLQIEKGCYNNVPATHRRCPTCKDTVEDEMHFMLTCPSYIEERKTLMNAITNNTHRTLPKTTSDTFTLFMSCPDPISLYIGQYISNALVKRNYIISNSTS